MKTKNTKRALLMSALSLLMCISMLIGSTFAWFTDEVTSSNNIIKSGTLDVAMYWADGTEDPASANWKDASQGAIFDYDLWEPGYTEVRHIKIENLGTLALKYQVNIVANGAVSKLADVIDVYYVDPATQVADRTALAEENKIGTLAAVLADISATASGNLNATESDTITIALKMQETAGNEYQNLSIGSDFAVQLLATQLTSEIDDFDNQYDKMATIDSEEELRAALAADYDLIALGANIELADSIVIPAGKVVAFDLAGYTLHQKKVQDAAYAMIDNKGDLTITDSVGTGKVSYEDITAYTGDPGWASNTIRNAGVLHIVGGTVENVTSEAVMNFGYPHAIDAYPGSQTNISGGTVKSINYDAIRMFCNSTTVATTANISGGTIYNRVSFHNPGSNTAGYGVLNITGGNFITTDNVSANIRLLNFSTDVSNMKATVSGGSFDKGFMTQNYNTAVTVQTKDWLTVTSGIPVSTAAELQTVLDHAVDGDVIAFVANIEGDITVSQKAGVQITIDGKGQSYAGVILVDGKSARYDDTGLTIRNINFTADSISADACIRLGNGSSETRYTNHVTVSGCTFDVPGAVGIKSYTGGDMNLTIAECVATAKAHSLVQAKGVDGILVENCQVYSKNGLNFNNSTNVIVSGCTVDVKGYAVRFGESSGGAGFAETYLIKNCALKSACDDNDAVIVLRGTADYATLTVENTMIEGRIEFTNTATGATIVM